MKERYFGKNGKLSRIYLGPGEEGDKLLSSLDEYPSAPPDGDYIWDGTNWIPDTAIGKAKANALIKAKLDANDLQIIRALVEGDTAKIAAHKISQAALRAQLQ